MSQNLKRATQFHDMNISAVFNDYLGEWVNKQDVQFTYTFDNFFHPFVGELIDQLNRKSLAGLFDPEFHQALRDTTFFDNFYTKLDQRAGPVRARSA